ncbi:RasGAP protein-like protein [Xylogone sp. PMI_703]|nr:RasGAP protein-like protein [Xylogone sp. PMI_703]
MDGGGGQHAGTDEPDPDLQNSPQTSSETLARSLERSKDSGTVRWRRNTVRAVTPEPRVDTENDVQDEGSSTSRSYPASSQTSPRSIPIREKQVDHSHESAFDDSESPDEPSRMMGPPVTLHSRQRTRTLDDPTRYSRPAPSTISKGRLRIGSVHASSSSSLLETEPRSAPAGPSYGFSNINQSPSADQPNSQLQKSGSLKDKDKKASTRRLVKRTSSRPNSPSPATLNYAPAIDVLASPVATNDANKLVMLMKKLRGRMRGEVDYQNGDDGPWFTGICCIDDVRGNLMCEGDNKGRLHVPVVPDLRGCRVRPIILPDREEKCLEIWMPGSYLHVRLVPTIKLEYDLWLAALLCWQQARAISVDFSKRSDSSSTLSTDRRPSAPGRDITAQGSKEANIIKIAKLLIWDKGPATSARSVVRRPSTRDLSSASRSWRMVSCILHDNGDLKLFTENDATQLSTIQLAQLSRSAIQRLDKSVLDLEYCIAIFPRYAPTSTEISIFRPVYICLESRVLFEVWFVLLRAFAIPELYGPQSSDDSEYDVPVDPTSPQLPPEDLFRIEKSISIRVIEAKIRGSGRVRSDTPFGQPVKPAGKVDADPAIGDYFAEIILDGEVRARTMTKMNTKNPFWREECEFQDLPPYLPRLSVVLKRLDSAEAASHGYISSTSIHVQEPLIENRYGLVEISIDKLERGKDSENWWPIIDDKQETIGEMLLKIRHDELVVLPAKDYQPISDLLHKFTNGLTLQIAQIITSNLRGLSETLMNIFQVSGHSDDWLMTLIEDEIDGIGKEIAPQRLRWSRRLNSNETFRSVSEREMNVRDLGKSLTGEANLLFRGNSLLTQAIDFHMRRLGKEYLEEVLLNKVNEINAMDVDCEVDPSRLLRGEDVKRSWAHLISLTTEIWNSIATSAYSCPPELRQILKYIRAVAEDRYGGFLRTVAYTSVSGIMFLRFFCPALLNPKLFGLLRDHPRPKAQRTLTLIAKSLQVLANLSTFGQKEAWMEPMNRFLASHRQGVKDFIDAICDIPTRHGTSNPLPPSYTTPITILTRLPPTSREGFPSLPYLIDHARSFAALIKLWLDTSENFIALDEFEGDLDEFNKQCIALQHRTDECLQKAEQAGERYTDQFSTPWEELVDGLDNPILRSSPVSEAIYLDSDPELQTPLWTEVSTAVASGSRQAPGSSGSEISGNKERRERQNFWELSFGKDSKIRQAYTDSDPSSQLGTSPPSRGQSRNGKQPRNFLMGMGLRKKSGKGGDVPDKEILDSFYGGNMI